MRRLLTYSFSVVWMVLLFVPMFPILLIGWPSHRWRLNISRIYSRWWSKGSLFAAGIRVHLEGKEHLRTLPCVLAFNHTNMLDFFVNATFAPKNCLVFGKKELAKVPVLGWMWACGGHPMIQRDKREQWQGLLDSVTARLSSGHYCTIVAPEGTRSRDGNLGPFKKGPFHFAVNSGAPIVPVIIEGAAPLLTKQEGLRPGRVSVRILPPIPTADWDQEKLEEHIDAVRQVYLAELGQ